MRYKANYEVDVEPMLLGKYCDLHWTTPLASEKYNTPGYLITYRDILCHEETPKVGWMEEHLFLSLFNPVDNLVHSENENFN